MAGLSENQTAIAATRAERDDARAGLRDASGAVARAGRARRLRRQLPGNPDLRAARRARSGARRSTSRRGPGPRPARRFRSQARRDVGDADLADPTRLFGQLDDHTPFLMLPVRLETRFWNAGAQPRARAHLPGHIEVSAHEAALTTSEVDSARDYWRRRADAARLGVESARSWPSTAHGRSSSIATRRAAPPMSCDTKADQLGRPAGRLPGR